MSLLVKTTKKTGEPAEAKDEIRLAKGIKNLCRKRGFNSEVRQVG